MSAASVLTHRCRGLDGYDFKTPTRKPGSIAAGACADIQDDTFARRQQVCQPTVQAFWVERLVLDGDFLRVAVVPGNRCFQFSEKFEGCDLGIIGLKERSGAAVLAPVGN